MAKNDARLEVETRIMRCLGRAVVVIALLTGPAACGILLGVQDLQPGDAGVRSDAATDVGVSDAAMEVGVPPEASTCSASTDASFGDVSVLIDDSFENPGGVACGFWNVFHSNVMQVSPGRCDAPGGHACLVCADGTSPFYGLTFAGSPFAADAGSQFQLSAYASAALADGGMDNNGVIDIQVGIQAYDSDGGLVVFGRGSVALATWTPMSFGQSAPTDWQKTRPRFVTLDAGLASCFLIDDILFIGP